MARRSLALTAAVLLAVGLVAGCSKDDGDDAATTTTAAAKTTTTSSTSTTAAPSTAAPTTAAPTVGYPTPLDAANHLVGAWKANDKVAAAQGAEQAAIDALWAFPVVPDLALYNNCDSGEFGDSGCFFRSPSNRNLTVQFNMEKRPEGWVVVEAVPATE